MILLTAAAGSGMYRDTTALTTLHLILIAALAAVVVLGILWGARQKRARQAAEQEEEARVEAMQAHPPTTSADQPPQAQAQQQRQEQSTDTVPGERADPPAPASAPPAPPVAPAPPPLGDLGLGQPAPAAAPPAAGYRLSDIKGLGPKAEPALAAQGVASVADLAALSPARAAEVDAGLGPLSGRLARDRWVEQAQLLAAGDRAGFEATFGKL